MNHPFSLRALLSLCVGILTLGMTDAAAAPKRLFELSGSSNGAALSANSAAVQKARLEGNPVKGRVTPVSAKSFQSLTSVSEGQEIEIPLASGETAKGVVNLVIQQAGSIRVAGHLTTEKGSFALSLERDRVGGLVQLERKGTAFRVETSNDGSAAIREMLRSEVICVPLPRPENLPRSAAIRPPSEAPPILNSRDGAVGVLYLDFDGATVTDPLWDSGRTINAPAAALTNAQITTVWERVKEDYWPFNVNVTTEEAKYTNAPVGRRMRCIITPNDIAAPGAGGVAYLNCFAEAGSPPFLPNIPCWVFIDNDAKACAEAISHEFGHTFGLNHDGLKNPHVEYFQGYPGPGQTGWAPIMGVGYYQPTVQWSKGEYERANNAVGQGGEDDVAIISNATNGIGYVTDETPNVLEGAIPLTIVANAVDLKGVITRETDIDFYVFNTTGGAITLAANGGAPSPNLDINLQVLDSTGAVIATSNPPSTLNANLSISVPPGNYFLRVEGASVGNFLTTGYSKYGSIGAYNITGTIEGGSSDNIPVVTSPGVIPALRGAPVTYTITATGSPTSFGVTGTLPPWMNFDAPTGVLSGTPTASGVFNIVVSATNANGTGTRDVTITINAGAVSLAEAVDNLNLVLLSGGNDEWLGVLDVSFDGEDGAESGPITHNQSTYMETTVEGPARVRFHWRTDSELDGDVLRFLIDGVERKKISGDTGWIEDSFTFPVGSHTLRWEYVKNDSVSVGLDHGWVDTVSLTVLPLPVITSPNTVIGEEGENFFYQIEADNSPIAFELTGTLPEGLLFDPATGIISGVPTGPSQTNYTMTAINEAGPASEPLSITVTPPILTLGESVNAEELEPWTTTGPQLWFPQTVVSADGLDAAQSGHIVHGQSTQMFAKIIGATAIRFKWKVSSEPKFDVLEFLVDGEVQRSISGEVDWQELVVPIPRGVRTISWRYRKDSGITAGADTAWLDQVRFDKAPLILGTNVATGRVNEPFFYRVLAVNTPATYEATGLPPGLTIDQSNGSILGTPTQLGEFPVNLTVTNDTGVETPPLMIVINETRVASDPYRASTYTGLVRSANDGKVVGLISIKIAAKQTYTGSLLLDRVRYSFKGKLDGLNPRPHQLRKKGASNITLGIKVDSRADVNMLTGDVQGSVGTAVFDAFDALPTTELPAGGIGKYTLLIEPDTLADELPGGTGPATMSVSRTGAVKVTGTLGDGQKFTASGPINSNKAFPFYSAPYRAGGVIAGLLPFDFQAAKPTLGGNLEWSKKSDLNSPVYSAGFAKAATATGAFYTKPPRNTRVLDLTAGLIELIGSDLTFTPREQPFTLSTANKIVVTPAIPSFKASIKTATGLISGSFRTGASGPVKKFSGAVLQTENRAAGVFVGTTRSGEFVLEATPTP